MPDVVTDRLYRGERFKDRISVMVHVAPGVFGPLAPVPGSAFDWGRPTAGASALATALMREVEAEQRPDVVEAFFHQVVLQLPFVEPWVLWRGDLVDFVARQPGSATAS